MSIPAVVWLVVGLVATTLMLAMVVGLFRQVKRLGRAVVDFATEVRPVLEDIQRETERARERSEKLQAKGETLRSQR
jgi:uncharacterized protein YoxC